MRPVGRVKLSTLPEGVRAFAFHGLDLVKSGNGQFKCDCPLCGRTGKFFVAAATGLWDCKTCGAFGNPMTFLRQLWDASRIGQSADAMEALRLHRNLLSVDTLIEWGVTTSAVDGGWIVPAYHTDGKICQLARYVKMDDRHQLLVTPGLKHGLYGPRVGPKVDGRNVLHVYEGPWDGMAAWEAMSAVEGDVRSTTDVVAVPSCTVWRPEWSQMAYGRAVIFLFDNDHPRRHPKTDALVAPASLAGCRRIVETCLSDASLRPTSVAYLAWGGDASHSADLPSGYDVRDAVREGGDDLVGRAERYATILTMVRPVPTEWLPSGYVPESSDGEDLQSDRLEEVACDTWAALTSAWSEAVRWTEGLDRTLSVMLAAAASTCTAGDQLWVKVVGPPGCGKSTLCEALAVNRRYVKSVSTIRGFHSGFKSDRSGVEDHSLIVKARDRTLVLKDGDTLLQSPNLSQILAEARDIYDRTSRAHYRHGLERDYQGVNMTWIICGTQTLRKLDHSELGARFLDCVVVESVDEGLEDDVLDHVAAKAIASTKTAVNGSAGSQDVTEMRAARQLTAGYLTYLRQNAVELASAVEWPARAIKSVKAFGKFVSYLRARPSERKEVESADREISTRLTAQLFRLAAFLAVVLNRNSVDGEVLRRVRRVAFDTARGQTYEVARELHQFAERGIDQRSLANLTNHGQERTGRLLTFLRCLGAVESFRVEAGPGASTVRWRLSDRFTRVYDAFHAR